MSRTRSWRWAGVVVSSFETTGELLRRMGFEAKSYQENRRTSFQLYGAQLEIDRWPHIPPYLEIESHSQEHVIEIAATLGFPEDQLTGENTTKVYARYNINLPDIRNLRFAN